VGGVVQVFTARAPQASTQRIAHAGQRRHCRSSAAASGGQGASAIRRRAAQRETAFPHHARRAFGSFNPDDDPFRQDAVNASLQYEINATGAATRPAVLATASTIRRRPGIDARATARSTAQCGVKGRHRAAGRPSCARRRATTPTTLSSPLSRALQDASSAVDLAEQRRHARWAWCWQGWSSACRRSSDDGLQRHRAAPSIARSPASTAAAAAQLAGQRAARRNSQFGDATPASPATASASRRHGACNASHGTSFVAPSFNQLYFPNFGNPRCSRRRGKNTDVA
jgi:vitamin B12 transporter